MLKYATRHYAHYRCWLQSRAAELRPLTLANLTAILATLHEHQLHAFPVLALSELLEQHGYFGKAVIVLKAALKAKEINAKGVRS